MKKFAWGTLAVAAVLGAMLVLGVGAALADAFHGAAVAKSTEGPVKVGDAYVSSARFSNTVDDELDILRVTGLSDTVAAASGNVTQGLTGTGLIFDTQVFAALPAGSITCDGTGAGTAGDPRINWTECFLDFNTRIETVPYSFYTVQPGDSGLPGNLLTNTITWNWNNTCKPGTTNCSTGAQTATASAAALVLKRDSATATDIHDGAHAVVTTVAVGTTVHDLVTVTGDPGQAVPTGNVNVDWFLNGTCTGAPAANSGSIGPLNAAGQFDATGFAFTVNTAGMRAFRGHYEGDGTYNPSDGPCEPLQVVDANISITPDGVNRVGDTHTFTAHVNVNDGTGGGFVNAPDGTQISFTKDSGPGTLGAPNPCTTSGGTGSCTITLTSATTGMTVVSAHTTVSVGGLALTRDTNGAGANSGPATKTWVNAAIVIAPNATNEVGQPHTFTATLLFDTGAGLQPAGAGEPITVTLIPSNGASPAPPGPFNGNTNAAGQFSVTFTSATPGQVAGHASWTGSVSGSAPFTVQTNGVAPNSGDAVKTFVDAYIEITPPEATNPVGTTHTYTAHVFVNAGLGAGYVNAPDNTLVTFTLLAGSVGSFTGGNTCMTTGGTCTIDTTSAVAGDDTMQASTTLAVGGVTMTRTTGQASPGHANSDNAIKHWEGGGGQITPTQVSCQDFIGGNAPTLDQVNYRVNGGKIHQSINPGVFFYWTKITTTVPNQVVTTSQTNTSTNNSALFKIHQDWQRVYTGNCSSWKAGTQIAGGTAASFTVPTPGNYVIGIKYDVKSLAGTTPPVPDDITFHFSTSLGSTTDADVLLKKQ